MVIYRNNTARNGAASSEEQRIAAVERHHERGKVASAVPAARNAGTPASSTGDFSVATPPDPGDVIYGAKAIARFIFGEDGNRARRRVFNLWTHYRDRQERAGFFKLKGALCLSKAQWRAFHGL
jgi:hypothetical protein